MLRLKLNLAFLLFFTIANATHNRGGEILYERIQPLTKVVNSVTVNVYNYRITVIKYYDHGQNIADRCVDTVYFGDGSKGIAFRSNGPTAGSVCFTGSNTAIPTGSIIINKPGYVVKKNVYVIDHEYPGPGNYLISSSDFNRNQGIVNIPNSVNQPFYLSSLLVINAFSHLNSSPVSANTPLGEATTVNCFYLNPSATDADGDSLSYELYSSMGVNGSICPGFTFPTFGPGGYFFIMNTTGQLHWCLPQGEGEYNFGIKINEWRKNTNGVYTLIGYVIRENQVVVSKGVLSIATTPNASLVQIYPNPFCNNLTLISDSQNKQNKAIIFSLDGKELMEVALTEEVTNLNTENLAPGIYFVKTDGGITPTFKKLVKQ